MKIVLFLGAGFSRAWRLPLMYEFFQHAKDSKYLNDGDKDFLRDLQRKAREGVSMLQISHDNLEEILSFSLASESYNAGYPEQKDSQYGKLCNILKDVYRLVDFEEFRNFNISLLERLLGFDRKVLSTGDLSIITTNYDVMIEFCISRLGYYCYLPFEWEVVGEDKKVAGHLYSLKKTGILLCKLHGSLNWFNYEKDKKKMQVESGIHRGLYDAGIEERPFQTETIYMPKICMKDYQFMNVPLIIPPTLFKMQTDERFGEIWKAAGQKLKEADKIVFIGFSFPESDTHIRFFLAANIYENIDLRKIEIVDPKAYEICEKLKKSYGIHFRDLLKPVEGKWEEIDYTILAS